MAKRESAHCQKNHNKVAIDSTIWLNLTGFWYLEW